MGYAVFLIHLFTVDVIDLTSKKIILPITKLTGWI